ncbi:MAG: DedA family protein [Alphaproteobacteria bacterium]|nr:DedA family protein [Alphaproteobacteria bacterium]MBU1515658.1 DedA family protein [Alphaproteobacteria bacterium]MBU2094917.1 DedA family protein [Alphaproteobacteria bacterium]MBU2150949.1 DedA family protein [Alphaproteobacteria bacterium]MBU2305926.1 DedA family protein [Alphaproteobacteria bacterium]
MFRKIYDWVMRLAASRHAPVSLAAISFAESSFFPIPPDVMLAPMVLARRDKAFQYAAICTIASVFGGLLGYAIGVWLEPVGRTILKVFGHPEGPAEFQKWFDQWGLWVILIKGATPIPYKLVTITAGLARFDLFTFVWASILTRGFRFFAVASILKYAGPAMLKEFERRLNLYSVLLLVLLIGGILALKVFL